MRVYNVCANECRAHPGKINIYAAYFGKSKGVSSEQRGTLSFVFLRFPLFPPFNQQRALSRMQANCVEKEQ